jgi:cellulose 1,4-beta-cellobiosidase
LNAIDTSSTQINLAWNSAVSATGYNLKRSTTSGGAYTIIATNLPYLNYSDTGLATGTAYYYVVSAVNSFGESTNSLEASAQTVSTNSPQLNVVSGAGQIQLSWPEDHLGWRLETQTNSINAGLGNSWTTVQGSTGTNQVFVPIDAANGSVFFRLVYP